MGDSLWMGANFLMRKIAPFIAVVMLLPGVGFGQTQQQAEGQQDTQASYKIGLNSLFDWIEGYTGTATVKLNAWAFGEKLTLEATSEDAAFRGLSLGNVKVTIDFAADDEPSNIQIVLDGPAAELTADLQANIHLNEATGSLTVPKGPISGLIQAEIKDLASLNQAFPKLFFMGQATVTVEISGTMNDPILHVKALGKDIHWRGHDVGQVNFTWDQADDLGDFKVLVGENADPTATASLKLPLHLDLQRPSITWLDDKPLKLHIDAKNLTADRFRPVWSAPSGADFLVNQAIDGQGSLDKLQIQGEADGKYFTQNDESPLKVSFKVEPDSQNYLLSIGDGDLTARVTSAINLKRMHRHQEVPVDAKLTGSASINLPFQLAAPFLKIFYQPRGRLLGQVTLEGTLGSPLLNGTIETNDAIATFLPLNRTVDDLDVAVEFAGNKLSITKASASSAKGLLTATGSASFVATPSDHRGAIWSAWSMQGAAQIDAKRFPVVQPGVPVAKADAKIAIDFSAAPGEFLTKMVITKGRLDFTGEKVPDATPIPSDPGVKGKTVLKPSFFAGDGHLVLDVEIKDPLPIAGRGLDLSIGGRLVLDRDGPDVDVTGGFDILPGGFLSLFDNRFDIRFGRLTLAGGCANQPNKAVETAEVLADADLPPVVRPLDPMIYLVARSKVVETHVMVKIQGKASKPELVLRSVPSLPPYQILTLLITGRVDVVDDQGGKVRREAAKLVDRFHNPNLKRQLFDLIGVDNLGLGFGSSASQPIVTVGKQINRQLYIETVYHHNAPPGENMVQGNVQYRLSHAWKLDTIFGNAGEGGIGAFWSTRFGGPPAPPAPDEDWGLESMPQDSDQECTADKKATLAPKPPAPSGIWDVSGHFGTIGFPLGKIALDEQGAAVAKATAMLLKRLSGLTVTIVGHSDSTGTEAENIVLSRSRAEAVQAVLLKQKVPRNKITVKAVGFSQPLDPADTPEAMAKNRRVELVFDWQP